MSIGKRLLHCSSTNLPHILPLLLGVVGIGQDITARLAQEREYSKLIDTANAPIFVSWWCFYCVFVHIFCLRDLQRKMNHIIKGCGYIGKSQCLEQSEFGFIMKLFSSARTISNITHSIFSLTYRMHTSW